MAVTMLYFMEREFLESLKNIVSDEKAVLELDDDKKVSKLRFIPTTSIIDKKIAERLALSICRSGFLLQNGERIGSGFELDIK